MPHFASTTADGVTSNTANGAVEFCKSRCDDASMFHAFSGQGNPNSPCSTCTGFFFQRHTNGHEICGFYTIDLNDKKLNKVGHGHSAGSRICTKTKLSVNTTTTFEDPTLAITAITDRMTNFRACGANNIVVSRPIAPSFSGQSGDTTRMDRTLTFRYDISDGPSNMNTTEMMKRFVVSFSPDRGRRLENTLTPSGCVQELGSCMEHSCSTELGWTDLSEPKVYCESATCLEAECCQCTSGSCTSAVDGSSSNANSVSRKICFDSTVEDGSATTTACDGSDTEAITTNCQCASGSSTNECVATKYCYDNTCNDAAKSTTGATTTPCTESDTEAVTTNCKCANDECDATKYCYDNTCYEAAKSTTGTTTSTEESTATLPKVTCNTMTGPIGTTGPVIDLPCAVAKCQAPLANCPYITRYHENEHGNCCPKLCHTECSESKKSSTVTDGTDGTDGTVTSIDTDDTAAFNDTAVTMSLLISNDTAAFDDINSLGSGSVQHQSRNFIAMVIATSVIMCYF